MDLKRCVTVRGAVVGSCCVLFAVALTGQTPATGNVITIEASNDAASVINGNHVAAAFVADLIKPVGDYENENPFRGSISGLFLKHPW